MCHNHQQCCSADDGSLAIYSPARSNTQSPNLVECVPITATCGSAYSARLSRTRRSRQSPHEKNCDMWELAGAASSCSRFACKKGPRCATPRSSNHADAAALPSELQGIFNTEAIGGFSAANCAWCTAPTAIVSTIDAAKRRKDAANCLSWVQGTKIVATMAHRWRQKLHCLVSQHLL